MSKFDDDDGISETVAEIFLALCAVLIGAAVISILMRVWEHFYG